MIANGLEVVCAALCIGSFVWAAQKFFRRSGGDNAGQRTALAIVGGVSAAQLLTLIVANADSIIGTGVSIALYAASGALFWWTVRTIGAGGLGLFFDPAGPDRLVISGPYRIVRHPFYASYLLCWIGGTIATQAWWLALTAILAGTVYWRAARVEEATFLASTHGAAYREYQQRTGMLLPGL